MAVLLPTLLAAAGDRDNALRASALTCVRLLIDDGGAAEASEVATQAAALTPVVVQATRDPYAFRQWDPWLG